MPFISKCISAPKYNGGQLYKSSDSCRKTPSLDTLVQTVTKPVNATLCIDWFEVTIEASEASFSSCLLFASDPLEHIRIGDFDFERTTCGTKRYKYLYQVYMNGERFGSICVQPRAEDILDKNWCQFKLDNHKLYQSGWTADIDDFLKSLDSKVRSYTRVDVAMDGYGYLEVLREFQDGKYDRLGRAKYTVFHEKFEDKDRFVTGINWGSQKGDKFMTIYNKSNKLEETNKGYISDFWNKSGLVRDERIVQRMELKMRSKAVKQIKDFHFSFLEDTAYLSSVMKTHFKRWFEFIMPGKDTNKTRAKRYEFIDWDSIGGKLLEKNSTKPSNEIWSVKISIRNDYFFYHSGKGRTRGQIREKVSFYGLENWYSSRRNQWDKKLVLQRKKEAKRVQSNQLNIAI